MRSRPRNTAARIVSGSSGHTWSPDTGIGVGLVVMRDATPRPLRRRYADLTSRARRASRRVTNRLDKEELMAIAFITGANHGIGCATASQLGQAGVRVVIGARDRQQAEQAAARR
jgi:hypothetical protein